MSNETTFLVFYRFRPLDSEEKNIAKQEWEDIKSSLPDSIELTGEFSHAWGTEYNGFLMFQSETSDMFFEWWSGFKDKIRWYVEKTHTIVARRRYFTDLIILMCGLPGTGKTFLSNKLSQYIESTVLSTDKIRKELIQKPTYTPWERAIIYDVLFLLTKYLHSSGINCILDGTFNMEKSRREVKDLLNLTKDQFYIIECICPEDLIITRLLLRKDDYSDATVSIYLKMKRIYEPIRQKHISINTSKPFNKNIDRILRYIYGSTYSKVIKDCKNK